MLISLLDLMTTGSLHADDDMTKLIELGCRCLDLEIGVLSRIEADEELVDMVGGSCPLVAIGERLRGERMFSSIAPGRDQVVAIERSQGNDGKCPPFFLQTGLNSLLASDIRVAGKRYGRLSFASRTPRHRRFDEREKLVLKLIAAWIGAQLDDRHARSTYQEINRRLAMSEKRYRCLYEKTPAMLHSIDQSGRLASVSEVWLATMGYERDEVIGRLSSDFLTEESRRYAKEVVLPAYMATGRCDNIEYQFVTKDGQVRDILLSAITQYDDDNRFHHSLAVLVDITKRKQVERLLKERTASLEQSNHDLARFAYIASHDLQEPLRRVVTYCQILMEDFAAEVSEEAADVIEIIQSGGKHLRLMITDLLAYSRLNEQLEQAFEPVDMAAILDHAIEDLSDEIEASGARIDAAHLPLVWGRALPLQIVCHHILSNAIKYGGEDAPRIKISIDDRDDVWQFAIEDSGIGIETRFADRIFEIFQRLHRKDTYQGSGAGLAICKLIIQRHGGTIRLDPTYEDGARFLFTLPKTRLTLVELSPASVLPAPVRV
jgi:PAS domain S-box-containing protein